MRDLGQHARMSHRKNGQRKSVLRAVSFCARDPVVDLGVAAAEAFFLLASQGTSHLKARSAVARPKRYDVTS